MNEYCLKTMLYFSDRFGRKIIQNYYAAVTYIDDLVGQILSELDKTKLSNNTFIVFTSDHGLKNHKT